MRFANYHIVLIYILRSILLNLGCTYIMLTCFIKTDFYQVLYLIQNDNAHLKRSLTFTLGARLGAKGCNDVFLKPSSSVSSLEVC